MSIVIQGIEMPKSCLNCLCYDGEYVCCNITGTYVGFEKNRPQDCPLKEVDPTADVAPVVHAHWNQDKKPHRCSLCNRIRPYEIDEFRPDKFDYWACQYCPHCGARMDEKEKEQ